MKHINTSNSTFETFINEDCLYVDKTAYLHQLISRYSGQYFLSRPRRFGKSLLVSTIKAIFQARRDLFKGLAIDSLDFQWKAHPIIHLNMGSTVADDIEGFHRSLMSRLKRCAKEQGLNIENDSDHVVAFQNLIEDLYDQKGPVVVLIDEYDKPLLGHLGEEKVKDFQKVLKDFYGVIKTTEHLQRFAFITGVSKFSKVSIFSDLNNLTDLTHLSRSATLLGYTQEELEDNFSEHIDGLAQSMEMTREQALEKLRLWYNGYRFEETMPTVYNPVSVMKCLAEQKFKNHWFETGTPTILIDLLRKSPLIPEDLSVSEMAFSVYDPQNLEVLPLLVQTGYLTIKGCETFGDERSYELNYPNLEVERSFNQMLAKGLGQIEEVEFSNSLRGMVKTLNNGDIEGLLKHLKVFFASIPYDIQLSNEKYYQTLFFTIFRLLNTVVEAETRTADGRVDAILKTPERIVLFEFKLHDSAQVAMDQINSKDYALSYMDDGREVIKVGVAFDPETRNLGEWLIR